MKLFKRKKNKIKEESNFNYENASVETLNDRVYELILEQEHIKTSNGLRIGMSAILGVATMLGVLLLTASFPIWASAILTFLSSIVVAPIIAKGYIKELKIKEEIKEVEKRLDVAIKEEELKEQAARITVEPQSISFGSQSHKELVKEFGENQDISNENTDVSV